VGTREVGGTIIASTLTTAVIFLPVAFMQTISDMIFRQLALVVVFAIVCSLFIALSLVPMLASRFLAVRPRDPQHPRWLPPADAGPAETAGTS
jgi:HAE1 family hydrophobic/amphiphilic exporter-1